MKYQVWGMHSPNAGQACLALQQMHDSASDHLNIVAWAPNTMQHAAHMSVHSESVHRLGAPAYARFGWWQILSRGCTSGTAYAMSTGPLSCTVLPGNLLDAFHSSACNFASSDAACLH